MAPVISTQRYTSVYLDAGPMHWVSDYPRYMRFRNSFAVSSRTHRYSQFQWHHMNTHAYDTTIAIHHVPIAPVIAKPCIIRPQWHIARAHVQRTPCSNKCIHKRYTDNGTASEHAWTNTFWPLLLPSSTARTPTHPSVHMIRHNALPNGILAQCCISHWPVLAHIDVLQH